MSGVVAIGIATVLVLAGAVFCYAYRDGRIGGVLAAAFLGRLSLLVLQRITGFLGYEDIGDYQGYFVRFDEALEAGKLLLNLDQQVALYTLLYPGWLYAALGPDGFWAIRLSNLVLSLLVVVPLDRISRRIWDRGIRWWQAGLVLFWPSYARFSVEVGRTVPTVLTALTLVAAVVAAFDESTWRNFVAVAFATVATGILRVHYVFYGVMASAAVFTHRLWTLDDAIRRLRVASGGAVLLIAAFTVFDQIIPDVSSLSLSSIRRLAKGTAVGGSAYLTSLYPQTILDFVWYLPTQAFYFLFSPMPWSVFAISNPFVYVAVLTAWSVFTLTVVTLWHCHRRILADWRLVAIFGTVALTALGFGAASKNAGASVRWRIPSTLLLVTVTTSLLADHLGWTADSDAES